MSGASSGPSSGASSGACLGQSNISAVLHASLNEELYMSQLTIMGHFWGIIWAMPGAGCVDVMISLSKVRLSPKKWGLMGAA